MREPPISALEAARSIASRIRDRTSAPVRMRFAKRSTANEDVPAAHMLRGGRGGAVRLKLELSFLWFAVKPPHRLAYPARAWATLLGLPDPAGRGARRVNEAVLWLEQHRFITAETRPGHPNEITLLSEVGTGEPYEPPGTAWNRLRHDRAAAEPHRYFQLPNEFWTNGWLAVLSGPAVAMFLVLLAELGGRDAQTTPLWFSPQQGGLRYNLSEDTRSKGLRELRSAGLVTVRRESVTPDVFDFRRLRNVYTVVPDQLRKNATVPDGPPPGPLTRDEAEVSSLSALFGSQHPESTQAEHD